jgi:putative ABC transport system permease protein
MLKNYFKIAWRNLIKNKGFFALNFTGLFVSVVACIIIGLIIMYEKSFDKNSNSKATIYRIVKQQTSSTGKEYESVTQYPLATAMRTQLPDEKLISQIHFHKNAIVNTGEKKFKVDNVVFADSVFPSLFHLAVQKGSITKAFSQPGFVVLTEKTAKKYFGKEEAVGKRIKLENVLDVEVAAVIDNAPTNSHLPYDMLISYQSFSSDFLSGLPTDRWQMNISGYTYIGLSNNGNMKQVQIALTSIADKNINVTKDGTTTAFELQPLSDIHYNQLYADENPSYTINYQYLYLIAAIGLFLTLAACINYTNLATAMAIKKSKETGIRKTMGANRWQLITQFLSETFLLTAFVIITAAVTAWLLIPTMNNFLEKGLPLNLFNLPTILLLIGLWLCISILSGIYPAFILSGFSPVNALKNKLAMPKTSMVFLRKSLVVFQFITAQILIIGALVVYKQMNYINSKPLGFSKERVVDIGLPENKPEQITAFKNALAAIPGINNISISLGAPVSDNGFGSDFNLTEKYSTDKLSANIKIADRNYKETYGLQLLAGRWFDEADEKKTYNSIPDSLRQYMFVINEATVKALGFSNPQQAIGKNISIGVNGISAPIIGVVKDYHIESLHATVLPVVMLPFPRFYYNAGIKLASGYSTSTIAAIEKAWSSVYPNYIFETNFLDEHVAKLYKNESRNQKLFNLFTLLSILINALGLIGLLSFVVEQKTKEIGIRKVLGASVSNISFILSKDFLRLIIIAFCIAAPVGWLLMNKWLQNFSYRTQISWWVFVLAAVAAIVVTCIAVGFQTIKAAVANPIKSLRTE